MEFVAITAQTGEKEEWSRERGRERSHPSADDGGTDPATRRHHAAAAQDGRRRRAVDAVLGRVRSAARPPALPREFPSSSSRRFDLGVNASRVVVVVVARALGSIRRPL